MFASAIRKPVHLLIPILSRRDNQIERFPRSSAGLCEIMDLKASACASPRDVISSHIFEPNTMERKKASDFPKELLDLLDRYVHGHIDRRGFLEGAQKFAVGGLTAMAIFESLRPNYAWAQQVPKEATNRIKNRVCNRTLARG